MSLYDEYVSFSQKYRELYGMDTVVLMEVGSFLELYDCDAHKGADMPRICTLLNIQMTRKNKNVKEISRTNPCFSGIPRISANKYIPLLLDAGLTVVMAMQVTPPPNPKRAVVEILSKSTCFASSILQAADDGDRKNNLMAIVYERSAKVSAAGWAVIDVSTGRSFVGESLSTSSTSELDALRYAVASANPAECVVITLGDDKLSLAEIKSYTGLKSCTQWPTNKEYTNVAFQDAILKKAFPDTGFLSPAEYIDLERRPHALMAYVLGIEFAHDHCEASVQRLQKPVLQDGAGGTLRMSSDALRQIDILDALLPMLNRCRTAMGRRAFHHRIANPWTCGLAMDASYDAIEAMAPTVDDVRKHLDGIADIEKLFKKIILKRASLRDVSRFGASLQSATKIIGDGLVVAAAQRIVETVLAWIPIEDSCCQDSIDFQEFNVGAFPQLDAALAAVSASKGVFQDARAALNVAMGTDHVRLEESPDSSCIFLSTTERRWTNAADKISNMISKLPWHATTFDRLTGRLSHPLLDGALEKWREAGQDVRLAHRNAVDTILMTLAEFDIGAIVKSIEDVDVTSTCTVNARDMRHTRPTPLSRENEKGVIKARGLRHPVIEAMPERREAYIANDVVLDYSEEKNGGGMLLYGVNAVGKSSVMKSLGIAVIMAQAGMFVACDGPFELYPFLEIHTRIGLKDDINRGQSTFIVEMMELRSILQRATGPSHLVIGDELCAGTESVSALAIVGSGVKVLSDRGVPFILATHLHELVELPDVKGAAGVRPMHLSVSCAKEGGELVFDRKLMPGPGRSTYGLEVCRSLDMGADFIRFAERIRRQVTTGHTELVRKKISRYNSSIVVDKCGVCGGMAEETHHISPQATACSTIKNQRWNLLPLCSKCHRETHDEKINIDGFKLTTRGIELFWSLNASNLV